MHLKLIKDLGPFYTVNVSEAESGPNSVQLSTTDAAMEHTSWLGAVMETPLNECLFPYNGVELALECRIGSVP